MGMTSRQWITRFVFMHKWVFLCGFIVTTIGTMINLIYPFLNGKIINIVFYEKNMTAFLNLCFIYAGLLVFNQFIVMTLNNLISSQLMTGFVFDIRRALFRKLIHKKGKDLSGMYSGDMISRMNNDTKDVMNLVFWSGLWGYSNLLHIVFAVGFMFYYNVFLGLFTVILVPVMFYTSRYFKKKSQLISKEISKEQGRLSSYLFEIAKHLQELKMLNAHREVRKFFLRKMTAINKRNVASGKVDVTAERVNALITLLAQLVLFVICAYFIVHNRMQLGVFVAALSYFTMAATYFSSINGKIMDAGKQLVTVRRVVDILNEEEEDYKEALPPLPIHNGTIEFRHVTFGYTGDKPVLNGFNLRIAAGSTVAVVGRSGAGKTSMANLLCRLYPVDGGELLIDGTNVNDYNLHSLRSQVGIVHQETILYDQTLRYNLSFSNNKDHDGELLQALQQAALYDVFQTLPHGLDTMLGVEGQELSGGQKQRLAIARILVKNPKILIFDEATSFLDSQNEALIRDMMRDMAKDRTMIIIAHRFSTIRNCDKIAVLADGAVAGYDTHEVLIQSNDTYIDLFREQCIGDDRYEPAGYL